MEYMSYKNLIAWQYAVDLAVEIMDLSPKLPREERYGLCSQMRRASVSIPSNIAEGYRRKKGSEDYRQFMRIALGSASELETQIIVAKRANFIDSLCTKKSEELLDHVQRLLSRMVFPKA
jgi:four helix bundle protein